MTITYEFFGLSRRQFSESELAYMAKAAAKEMQKVLKQQGVN